jgi:hypothetical protein
VDFDPFDRVPKVMRTLFRIGIPRKRFERTRRAFVVAGRFRWRFCAPT